jgi:hypothetical protein
MTEELKSPEVSSLASELDAAATTLDSALAEAGRAVAAIRSSIPQIGALAEAAREMEAAMARARESLSFSMPSGTTSQEATSPPLRPVPPQEEAASEPSEREAKTDEPAATPAEPEPSRPDSRCLRLDVSSKAGSLDLKSVDESVNENPAVVDVALLDYDGRQATLKLWINGSSDLDEVQEALLASLRSRLGDDEDAEVRMELEEESAA